jgi:hypothetical protein
MKPQTGPGRVDPRYRRCPRTTAPGLRQKMHCILIFCQSKLVE